MAGRRPPRNAIAERRRKVYLDVLRGLSIIQISSKYEVDERTVDRDLNALRKRLAPEDAHKLRRAVIANVSRVFTREKAAKFISRCQKIIRGEAELLPKQLLPRLSKRDPNTAREVVRLLRTTDKSLRQITRETGANRKVVTLTYQRIVARGEKIAPREKAGQIPKRAVVEKRFSDPEKQINLLETMAQKAGLTLQEKAVVYCKLVGMQRQQMAKIIGISKFPITLLLKSAREEMSKLPSPKP